MVFDYVVNTVNISLPSYKGTKTELIKTNFYQIINFK